VYLLSQLLIIHFERAFQLKESYIKAPFGMVEIPGTRGNENSKINDCKPQYTTRFGPFWTEGNKFEYSH